MVWTKTFRQFVVRRAYVVLAICKSRFHVNKAPNNACEMWRWAANRV